MNINEAAEHLRQLAQSNPHRSKTACLRELYVEIEAARKAGFKTEKIVDALNEKGLDINLATFVTLMHRIRKQLGHVATVSAGSRPNRRAGGLTKAPEQSAAVSVAPARGVRIKKVEGETSKEFAANFVAKNSNKPII